ncbi:hypothetical protein [Chitinophaga nivalis]|uniref:Uncharacterized protein n=1 Tax=Chitinophaga nivalis TaxID=2991709 RepID=A0ABT3IMK5_9BACT|nr:hypothetical protein [Chitinophaga nivalis]MCW3465118.1 hypothetical protein [Chitinophaga nivalis]MCW3485190.1 hypothetical protein [Chitinophaga nivalis]
MNKIIPVFLIAIIGLAACSKKDKTPPISERIIIYDNLVFSALKFYDQNQYFSTFDTSFKRPKGKSDLTETQLKNVDILYFYDWEDSKHGFMDPKTAGKEWYWNNKYYYYPWLSGSKQTVFYTTELKGEDFIKVKSDPGLFDTYFKDTVIAKHPVFPDGSCIGGRSTLDMKDLARGQVWALKSSASGKRSFLYIRADQEHGWPDYPIKGFSVKVDIITEK